MSLRKEHELHGRRFGRNLGVGLTLAAFIVIVFSLTIVKVSRGDFQMVPNTQVQN
ncbi:hypothetical protein TRL7639_02890 [Falsiruegeria litorea R37]|uniref:Cytochrome C oxidase assembly protein n=1 Tax=Falsiruegeria litorea R37 TaxID=1200284 RepID=A0A1Y5T5Z8_9RHOB|nr:hypothetical protein [Falsiruegeria litorea]SLN54615.1 hypothetical protein TRL7639_02890 [Falsiruegeria litorea R37]